MERNHLSFSFCRHWALNLIPHGSQPDHQAMHLGTKDVHLMDKMLVSFTLVPHSNNQWIDMQHTSACTRCVCEWEGKKGLRECIQTRMKDVFIEMQIKMLASIHLSSENQSLLVYASDLVSLRESSGFLLLIKVFGGFLLLKMTLAELKRKSSICRKQNLF